MEQCEVLDGAPVKPYGDAPEVLGDGGAAPGGWRTSKTASSQGIGQRDFGGPSSGAGIIDPESRTSHHAARQSLKLDRMKPMAVSNATDDQLITASNYVRSSWTRLHPR